MCPTPGATRSGLPGILWASSSDRWLEDHPVVLSRDDRDGQRQIRVAPRIASAPGIISAPFGEVARICDGRWAMPSEYSARKRAATGAGSLDQRRRLAGSVALRRWSDR